MELVVKCNEVDFLDRRDLRKQFFKRLERAVGTGADVGCFDIDGILKVNWKFEKGDTDGNKR